MKVAFNDNNHIVSVIKKNIVIHLFQLNTHTAESNVTRYVLLVIPSLTYSHISNNTVTSLFATLFNTVFVQYVY